MWNVITLIYFITHLFNYFIFLYTIYNLRNMKEKNKYLINFILINFKHLKNVYIFLIQILYNILKHKYLYY